MSRLSREVIAETELTELESNSLPPQLLMAHISLVSRSAASEKSASTLVQGVSAIARSF